MRSAEVPRVADDEPVFEAPFAAQWIAATGNRTNFLVIAPVGDDVNAVRREAARANPFGHAIADHDIGLRGAQRAVAQPRESATERALDEGQAEQCRDYRVAVLLPGHE